MGDNGLYLVTRLLNEKFRAAGFNTIHFTDINEEDLQKQSIFPLMHITLSNRTFADSYEIVTCSIVWADIIYDGKPLDSRTVPDVMSNVTNVEDIFHDLGYRINGAWQKLKRDLDQSIELPETLSINAKYAQGQNKLAVYDAQFEITIQNLYGC